MGAFENTLREEGTKEELIQALDAAILERDAARVLFNRLTPLGIERQHLGEDYTDNPFAPLPEEQLSAQDEALSSASDLILISMACLIVAGSHQNEETALAFHSLSDEVKRLFLAREEIQKNA